MADPAPANRAPNAPDTANPRFTPRGVPVITGVNRIGVSALYMKEVRRFLKVQTQTVWAPAVTTLLFLAIFTVALGRQGREVLGVPFATFVAPGLIVMGMMQNAFANSSFSLLGGKIQGTIIDYLMPPLSPGELMAGIIGAAMTRAVAVGCAVALAMALWPGVDLSLAHIWAVVWFGLMGAALLALLGLATSIWAEKFDHNAAITNFVIAPLSLLSGHVLHHRQLGARVPGRQPRQPVLLRNIGVPLRLPGGKRHRIAQRSCRCSDRYRRAQPAAGAGRICAPAHGVETEELTAAGRRLR